MMGASAASSNSKGDAESVPFTVALDGACRGCLPILPEEFKQIAVLDKCCNG